MKKTEKIMELFQNKGRELYGSASAMTRADDGFRNKVMLKIHALDYKSVRQTALIERESTILWRFSLVGLAVTLVMLGVFWPIPNDDLDSDLGDSLNAGYNLESIYNMNTETEAGS